MALNVETLPHDNAHVRNLVDQAVLGDAFGSHALPMTMFELQLFINKKLSSKLLANLIEWFEKKPLTLMLR